MPPRGFTLIELLTVIAIISLLIGVLVPAVSAARDAAKRASSRQLQESLGKGCEMFHRDFDRYPRSSGPNPFEDDVVYLSGAQWLLLQLAGADLKGYVMPDKERQYAYTPADWRDFYSLSPTMEYSRLGPYVQVEGKVAQSPDYYVQQAAATALPDLLKAGTQGDNYWPNNRLAFPVDAFGFPVLYYAANEQASQPFSDTAANSLPGRYTQWDNTPFTGSENGSIAGFDLGGGANHPLYNLGWLASDPKKISRPDSFAGVVYDRAMFEQNKQADGSGRVWPCRPDTFLLIAPGKDGLYGTGDDVTNFQ
jgi:prepilin-type N-terminal cleavage/methylation domain-containing protein